MADCSEFEAAIQTLPGSDVRVQSLAGSALQNLDYKFRCSEMEAAVQTLPGLDVPVQSLPGQSPRYLDHYQDPLGASVFVLPPCLSKLQ